MVTTKRSKKSARPNRNGALAASMNKHRTLNSTEPTYPKGNSINVGTVRALYILDDDVLVLHIKHFQLALKLLVSLGMGKDLALPMGDELPTVARLELSIVELRHSLTKCKYTP
jgi:hypothetical protein